MDNLCLNIITITKDDPTGLARTLASAAAFRANGAEHLVIDGSRNPATTRQLIDAYDSRVVVYPRDPQGISDAFNAGLAEARGDWVWFINGGDVVHEQLDATWLLAHLGATGADLVTGSTHFDGATAARRMPHLSYQWPLIACWLGHPATVIRRKALVEAGGFDRRWRVAMDYDLWFRLLRPPAVVDVISIPIARFDTKGISEQPESRSLARREEAKVIVRHSLNLAWAGVWLGLRIVRRLAWALVRVWL